MAEESTRKLLKLFGIAVTEYEDAVQNLLDPLQRVDRSNPTALLAPLEAYVKASGALTKQWAEVAQLISVTHERANQQLQTTFARLKA